MPTWEWGVEVLEVAAYDVALEDADAIDGLEAAAHPVAGIGAGADAGVAIFQDGKDIIGVPHAVIWILSLARVIVEQSDLTSQGVVVGTPAYMSPEQVNGEPLDSRSDLFSLGCVMYAMTAGYSPFRGEHPLGIARRVTSQKHVSLAEISKDVPPYFIRIVNRLLEKDPKDPVGLAAYLP